MIFRLLQPLVRSALRRAFRQGVLEGSVLWLAAGAGALLVRLLFRPEEPRVQRERLRVGETLVVTHRGPPERVPRRERRRRS